MASFQTQDLHDIIKKHGIAKVASVLGRTERQILDLRRGYHPLTVDDLFELGENFSGFSLRRTVKRIGERRRQKSWSRKARSNAKTNKWVQANE